MDWALELAENPNTYMTLRSGQERIVTDRFVLWLGTSDHPAFNVAQRFRIAAHDLDEVRAEIHARLRAKGRSACSWEVGSSATPANLVDLLLERGLTFDDDPVRVGMALTHSPAAKAEVEVRRAETMEEFRIAERIASEVFGSPYVDPEPPEADSAVYLACIDGAPVARASAGFSEHGVTLFGGAVLPEARGRGVYRALVHARWEDAVIRGTPLAVTDAGSMSRPILERMGFRAVCTITALIDRF